MNKTPGLSYRDAGVDIAGADLFVHTISALAKQTHNADVLPDVGAFAGLMQLNTQGMQKPALAAACDGVGTKLLVARKVGWYEGLGQDLVAMNVNDLLPVGARPLFFLDYIATGKLEPEILTEVVRGIANACKAVGCVLLGGETAEMPGLYPKGDFDLAGFTVGIFDAADKRVKGPVQKGDRIFALPSSGVHANGLSLARKALFESAGHDVNTMLPGLKNKLGMELLTPTRLYVNEVLALLQDCRPHAAAHITGGGILNRVRRMIPDGLSAQFNPSAYPCPEIFHAISQAGNVSALEMHRTFNMGLGYVIIVQADDHPPAPWLEVGEVTDGDTHVCIGGLCV